MKDDYASMESNGAESFVDTAPSLRVPVTEANRSFLRWLRAAELSAFEMGRPCECEQEYARSVAIFRNEHQN